MSTYREPGKTIEVDPGVELYYEEKGEGDPIIFIPGWTFTTEVFDNQLEYFSKNYRAIAYDPRSHGRSTVTMHGNDYATHGADLAKLINGLGLENVTLVGWSFGALNMWAYVRQEGIDKLKSVVTVDLSPKPLSVDDTDWVEGPLDEIGGAHNAFLQSPGGQRDFVTGYATEVMVQRELSDAELAWIVGQSLKTPYYIAALNFASGMFSDYLEEAHLLDSSDVKTMTFVAEHWSDTATAFMKKHCPNSPVQTLGGHLMFWEHPEKFNALLEEFLS